MVMTNWLRMKTSDDKIVSSPILGRLLLALPSLYRQHIPTSDVYDLLKQVARQEVENIFYCPEPREIEFGPFGCLVFPYHPMGVFDSLNLFDLDELIILSFYWTNRYRYQRVLDVGANIGLHSIILSRCGFEIRAYEPDPEHFKILQRNLALNHCDRVTAFNQAISDKTGVKEFIRVLGNTTGNHLAGSKPHPYGELERFPVEVEAIEPLFGWADLIKLDAEGHEKEILLSTRKQDWLKTDALVEVENETNAKLLYEHFGGLEVNLFSQKINWQRVTNEDHVPTSYREGTLFVTCKNEMPWK